MIQPEDFASQLHAAHRQALAVLQELLDETTNPDPDLAPGGEPTPKSRANAHRRSLRLRAATAILRVKLYRTPSEPPPTQPHRPATAARKATTLTPEPAPQPPSAPPDATPPASKASKPRPRHNWPPHPFSGMDVWTIDHPEHANPRYIPPHKRKDHATTHPAPTPPARTPPTPTSLDPNYSSS